MTGASVFGATIDQIARDFGRNARPPQENSWVNNDDPFSFSQLLEGGRGGIRAQNRHFLRHFDSVYHSTPSQHKRNTRATLVQPITDNVPQERSPERASEASFSGLVYLVANGNMRRWMNLRPGTIRC
jgi:hypothetical protein